MRRPSSMRRLRLRSSWGSIRSGGTRWCGAQRHCRMAAGRYGLTAVFRYFLFSVFYLTLLFLLCFILSRLFCVLSYLLSFPFLCSVFFSPGFSLHFHYSYLRRLPPCVLRFCVMPQNSRLLCVLLFLVHSFPSSVTSFPSPPRSICRKI